MTNGRTSRNGWLRAAVLGAALGVVAPAAAAPARVVSINLCTDQLAIDLAAPGQLVSVSRLARDPTLSDRVAEAERLPVNDGEAEEVVGLAPDLVLAGTYTAQTTVTLLRQLGWRVETFVPAESFDGIRAEIRRVGALLGRQAEAEAAVAAFDARLDALAADAGAGPAPVAAIYHVGNRTEGSGTLLDEILRAAGWRNLAGELGISGSAELPLESLVLQQPDLIVAGSSEAAWTTPVQPNILHPALLAAVRGHSRLGILADRSTICGTPDVADAVADLVAKRHRLRTGPAEVPGDSR